MFNFAYDLPNNNYNNIINGLTFIILPKKFWIPGKKLIRLFAIQLILILIIAVFTTAIIVSQKQLQRFNITELQEAKSSR